MNKLSVTLLSTILLVLLSCKVNDGISTTDSAINDEITVSIESSFVELADGSSGVNESGVAIKIFEI